MPGTAFNNHARAGQTARPSAKYRPIPSSVDVPVLLRLPSVESAAGAHVSAPANAPSQPAVSAATANPPSSPSLIPSSPSNAPTIGTAPEIQVEVVIPPQVAVKHDAKRSWWEHWSSGIVLFVLMLALFLAAMIAFNDSQNSRSSSLADGSADQTKPTSDNSTSIANMEIPKISLGEPMTTDNVDLTLNPENNLKLPQQSSPPLPRPISQVSVRTGGKPSEDNEQLDESSSSTTQDNSEVRLGGEVQLGLPTPIKDGSTSTQSTGSTLHKNSLIVASPSSVSIEEPNEQPSSSATVSLDKDQESLIPTEAGTSTLSLDKADASRVTTNISLDSTVAPTAAKPDIAEAQPSILETGANAPTTLNSNSPSRSAENSLAATTTPEFETEQLVKLWLEFSQLRNVGLEKSDGNRYQSSNQLPSQSPAPTQQPIGTTTSSVMAGAVPTANFQSPLDGASGFRSSPTVAPFQPVATSPSATNSIPAMTAGFRAPNTNPTQPTLQTQPVQQFQMPTPNAPISTTVSPSATPALPTQFVPVQTNGSMSNIPYPSPLQANQPPVGSNVTTAPLGLIGSQGPSQPQ